MYVCLARQPIFDINLNVIGYELLYRSKEDSAAYDGTNPDRDSSEVIIMGLDAGIKTLTGNRLAFINFTQNLLLSEAATILPKKHLIVEILEDVSADEEILAACRKLKKQGYTITMDDFVLSDENSPFLEFADMVKIDFLDRDITSIKKDAQKLLKKMTLSCLQKKLKRERFLNWQKAWASLIFKVIFLVNRRYLARRN